VRISEQAPRNRFHVLERRHCLAEIVERGSGVLEERLRVNPLSCLAEQAKILVAEAEENNLSSKVWNERFERWDNCSLCEQRYHGVVHCALGWACWKTYLGRPETDAVRCFAMNLLGNGLAEVRHDEDALTVREATLSLNQRLCVPYENNLAAQSNLAGTYERLGRDEEALRMRQDVYSGWSKFKGKEHEYTLMAANNCAWGLFHLERFEEAKALLRKPMRVARRVLGENHHLTLRMRWAYARALYRAKGATLDNFRESAETLEDTQRIARRVLGGAHPVTTEIEDDLQQVRPALRASEAGHHVVFVESN
jgi:tetratricopeptide (TPR) repeat protein